ncbi:hypothetical protein CVT26_010520 [Gymnopilus dilepis]|uniref:Cation/H+ exchanger transmembrane domain-containing protein n=1 Tax=Gymnopilus dilepis TaxID=231916 RepID=A0A409W545_9AGAR|nr:hypothetical protein CVT26_010520 [Gymnopilus dilepis]
MSFKPLQITTPHIVYALLGAFIVPASVMFGMFSLFLREKMYIGEALWAFIFGVIVGSTSLNFASAAFATDNYSDFLLIPGPFCLGIVDPRSWGSVQAGTSNLITLELTRVVLSVGVFAIGAELPNAYIRTHWRSLFFLLAFVMTWGWLVSASLVFALIPGLNFVSSLAVAACLTPTDPILASAVVGGKWATKHVPAHIRHLLAAESACNDGAAYPFLYLALYLIIDKTTSQAITDWFVILSCVIGSVVGFSFRHLMKFCQRYDLIDRTSYVAQYLSLTMLTIGITSLLGVDDLLAAFFCGTAFAWDGFFNKQTEESVFSSVVDTLFNVATFIYVGAWMPFDKFQDRQLTLSVWRLLVIALLILLLRRLPALVLLYTFIPDVETFREAIFTGHFGPIGISAIFVSTLATLVLEGARTNVDFTRDTSQTLLLEQTIQPIVAFMVLCSITVHGLSIPGFSFGKRVHTVSRSWSRRDTAPSRQASGRLPEWANQTTMVSRAEDVVINGPDEAQISNLEKGGPDYEQEKVYAPSRDSAIGTSTETINAISIEVRDQTGLVA